MPGPRLGNAKRWWLCLRGSLLSVQFVKTIRIHIRSQRCKRATLPQPIHLWSIIRFLHPPPILSAALLSILFNLSIPPPPFNRPLILSKFLPPFPLTCPSVSSLPVDGTVHLVLNHLNPELNHICYLLALLAHNFLHVSRIRVKLLTLRRLMSYIYGAPILDVSRSHTTTQHSR